MKDRQDKKDDDDRGSPDQDDQDGTSKKKPFRYLKAVAGTELVVGTELYERLVSPPSPTTRRPAKPTASLLLECIQIGMLEVTRQSICSILIKLPRV